MNKIRFPLTPEMRGPQVTDLQAALGALLQRGQILDEDREDREKLTALLRRERAQGSYGPATRALIAELQRAHRLQTTGAVDEATASLLNKLLDAAGLLDEREPSDASVFVVRGHVVDHEGRGLPGLVVTAVDKNVGQDIALGESRTDERGAYEIRYPASRIRAGKERPDLQVVAVGPNGKRVASAIRYNAAPEESGLDVVVAEGTFPRPAEFRRLVDALGPHLGVQDEASATKRLAGLEESEARQDVTYLANKTGWDARLVAMTALASRYGGQSRIEPAFYYALFRAGVPANDAALSGLRPEAVQRVWENAAAQGILPPELKEKIPQSVERFKADSARRLLEGPAAVGVSGFKEILALSVSAPAAQARLASLYYEHQNDLNAFWTAVTREFPEAAERLRLDGKLAFLTINNAPLIRSLHARHGDLRSPLDLVRRGFFRPEAWKALIGESIPLPDEIPGATAEEKRSNYAALMASHLRVSYPTAVVAELVRADEVPLRAEAAVKDAVVKFLAEHQGEFELGLHPIEHYLKKRAITLDAPVLTQVKRLQRVYQISPSDEVMGKLLAHGLDSAYSVVRYDEQAFVKRFRDELGGEALARLTYAKAHQVHHAVLNITTAYLVQRSAPVLYALQQPTASGDGEASLPLLSGDGSGVLAYPTLEAIFGELDYCTCEHCRSWLSPAAYLVDLLQFLDVPDPEKENPLDVLIGRPPTIPGRRPDIAHLALTCENTNTVLPYVDLVNEILEHFVVNGSLATFTGHDVGPDVTAEELLANPQFVNDAAYTLLRDSRFPIRLPFHRPLEALRRYFDHFEVPLHEAMERLRPGDAIDRPGAMTDPAYGWRDILMERLLISRQEYAIFTDSHIPLPSLYGLADSLTDAQLVDELSNAKKLSRRLGLSLEELVAITRTRFVNPHCGLIPKLERLGIDFGTIQAFVDGSLSEADLDARLPADLDAAAYGGDVKAWLRNQAPSIMRLIVLSDPTGSADVCSFDTVELRYALPDFAQNKLDPVEFLKMLRFVRLWRKLGWSIEQTDQALSALYPAAQYPLAADDAATARGKLDAGFGTFLVRLGHLRAIMEQLELTPERDLAELLACWATIDTHGPHSLYRRMFLNPTTLPLGDAFAEDGYGNYLSDPNAKLLDHVAALRAACQLTDGAFDQIVQELGFDATTPLNVAHVSAIFRHGYLARKLRLSVEELLALKRLSGLDPFQPLDLDASASPGSPFGSVRPPAIRFIELAQRIDASPLNVIQWWYHLQHVDLTGRSSPPRAAVLAFAQRLRSDLWRIERDHAVEADPTGEIARLKMALVYGQDAADRFFGLLNASTLFSVTYSHAQPALPGDILAVTDRIAYDDFQKKLSFRGVMTPAEKAALEAAPGATDAFRTAVQALFDASQDAFAAFFARYPELKGLYEAFADSADPREVKMSALLAAFLPALRARLKQQQIEQTVSAQLGVDLDWVTSLLNDPAALHAVGAPSQPAGDDFLGLEQAGLTADFFLADDVTGTPAEAGTTVSQVDYGEGRATLPAHPAGGDARISGRWRGFVEAPDNGAYNFYIDADPGAEVQLVLDGKPLTLAATGSGGWRNQDAVLLEAGRAYALELVAKKVKRRLVLAWERQGMGRTPIPSTSLYPHASFERFHASYVRVLKALAIQEALALSAAELAHFATAAPYQVRGEGWLNALPTSPSSDAALAQALFRSACALIDYHRLREALGAPGDRLIELLQDPARAGEDGVPLLDRLTGWDDADRTALLSHFGLTQNDLGRLETFLRLYDAFGVLGALHTGAAAALASTTNEPSATMVRTLQAALRARHAPAGWLEVVRPINDALRRMQRDALVAHVLHTLAQNPATAHIDTPEKLYEYFLIDVQMDPCMQTSRIRQAIASVQLFVQRCLLNLEPAVAPSSIKSKQWEWMKRYRVWEANRKVFLWPENWLEPELRDDKSPFFKDLESELLQSDITDDAAATALVHYLEKLDDVAKLEIVGLYYHEHEEGNEADDVVHVIARTAGARRTYYYRRFEYSAWTPWERVDVNIEGDPVLPVVWKGRLFLFWTSVLQESPPKQAAPTGNASKKLSDLTPSDLSSEVNVEVKVSLYWSERYHGKWQPPRSSDVNKPLSVGSFSATGANGFDRAKLTLASSEAPSGALQIAVSYPGKPGGSFILHNTHSLPVRDVDEVTDPSDSPIVFVIRRSRGFSAPPQPFTVSYFDPALPSPEMTFDRKLFERLMRYRAVEPHHPLSNAFTAPFFFQDGRHAFFVRTKERRVYVGGYIDVGIRNPPLVITDIPPLIVTPAFPRPPVDGWRPHDGVIGGVAGPIGPVIVDAGDPGLVMPFLAEHSYIGRAIARAGAVRFGERLIGPGGSVAVGRIVR